MGAINGREFGNYLFRTETYESLKIYIAMDFHGLRQLIVDMLPIKKLAQRPIHKHRHIC